MRKSLLPRKRPGSASSSTRTIPAPVEGWDASSALSAMPPRRAVKMVNFFPEATGVSARKGSSDWVTGLPQTPKTLVSWVSGTSFKLFAVTDAGFYDVTSAGAVGAVQSSLTNGEVSFTNFTTVGGNFLISVNGTDALRLYNGTTWSAITDVSAPIAITGVSTSLLTTVTALKNRLWFTEANSARVHYLNVNSIGGALTAFPFGPLLSRGGSIVAMGSWSVDGGVGQEDLTVFASSEGELLVYRGTDPSSSATWTLVGIYYLGEPLGSNCFTKFGGDLLYLCRQGLFPLSKVLAKEDALIANLARRVAPAFAAAAASFGSLPGWKVTLYPAGSALIVNVPVEAGVFEQYVYNTQTNAWCQFSNWNTLDFAVLDSKLYFLSASGVQRGWEGASDSGSPVLGEVIQAYTALGAPARTKTLNLLRPVLNVSGLGAVDLGISTDYETPIYQRLSGSTSLAGGLWDISDWDLADWASENQTLRSWVSLASNPFYTAAICLKSSSSSDTLTWTATDVVYEVGSIL